ncbi:hypothetical protein ES703_33487 [subsurface metagenome]
MKEVQGRRSRRQALKEMVAIALIVALGVILELHFVLFKVKGRLVIGEDNPWILNLEIAVAAAIILFGIERCWDYVKRWGKRDRGG